MKVEDFKIRPMLSPDLSEVIAIERHAHAVPWSRLSFEESLSGQHIAQILEYRSEIVGFYVVCPIVDELHILNLVIAPVYQQKGLGHLLLEDISNLAMVNEANKILLEVRASNEIAKSLYQKWQFKQIGRRKKYYRTTGPEREDALVLAKLVS